MADVSTVTIQELTGRKRAVVLRGPSLPLRPAGWGGGQRVVTTWNPGNAIEATQHILGPTEKESAWEGSLNTTLMLRTPTFYQDPAGSTNKEISRASTLSVILEDIFRQGQRLRVTWQNTQPRSYTAPTGETRFSILPEQTFSIVREGRCKDWDFNYDRADDITWTMVFDWASRGAVQQKVLTTRTETTTSNLQALAVELETAAIKVSNLVGAIDRKIVDSLPNRFTLDDIENMIDAPKDLMRQFAQAANLLTNRVKRIGDLIQKTRTLPASLANQALDVANNAMSVAQQFIDTMNRRPPEVNSLSSKVSQLTRTAEFIGDSTEEAQALEAAAIRMRSVVQEAAQSLQTILAVHLVRGVIQIPDAGPLQGISGELLADISNRYYSTADHAPSIARANNLPLSLIFIERGKVLIIPTLDAIRQFSPQGN